MSARTWLGIDVGGANIKVATPCGDAASYPFALWQAPHQLADKLREIISTAASCDAVAATMTGELADCYPSKRQGVTEIVDALVAGVGSRSLQFYLTDGTFVGAEQAKHAYQRAAASNWHALGSLTAQALRDPQALLVDIGSTTCDVIPLAGQRVVSRGHTDTQRLGSRELVYLGVERTPVSMLVSELPYRGGRCPIAREVFATTLDAHLVAGELAAMPQHRDTADGRAATRQLALQRLGRCLCVCDDEFTLADGQIIADFVLSKAASCLQEAVEHVVLEQDFFSPRIVLSGHGRHLFDRARQRFTAVGGLDRSSVLSLAEICGLSAEELVSRCASAWAVAALAEKADRC